MDALTSIFETDGWTIYLWLIVGAIIIIAVIYWMRWGVKNEQFDEDIKYLVFDKGDKDKMSAEEYAKSQEVMQKQMESRERHLAMKRGGEQAHKA